MKLSIIGCFNGKTIKGDGLVDLKFKFPFSEIAKYANLLTCLNNPLKIALFFEDKTKAIIGTVYLKKLSIDKDGEATVIFTNDNESIKDIDLSKVIQKQVIVKIIGGNN